MRVHNFYVSNIVYIEVNDMLPFFHIICEKIFSKIAISICTLFVLPAKISELDLKYMSRLGLAYSF